MTGRCLGCGMERCVQLPIMHEVFSVSFLKWEHAICYELCIDDPAIWHRDDENVSRYMLNSRLDTTICRSWFASLVPV